MHALLHAANLVGVAGRPSADEHVAPPVATPQSGRSGSIGVVTLILLYLVVLVLVAAVLFVIASAVFGRGEPLPPQRPQLIGVGTEVQGTHQSSGGM